jgi:hypothetical protein
MISPGLMVYICMVYQSDEALVFNPLEVVVFAEVAQQLPLLSSGLYNQQ